jgi:hypothetical protein
MQPTLQVPSLSRLVLLVVALVAVVFGSAALGACLTGDDGFDDLASWVEATSTLAALLAATTAAVYAAGAFRLETEREEAFQDARNRAQAELIGAWPVGLMYPPDDHGRPHADWIAAFQVEVRNASQFAVQDMLVQVHAPHVNEESGLSNPVAGRRVAYLAPSSASVLWSIEPPEGIFREQVGDPYDFDEWAQDVTIEVSFRDTSGVRWKRDKLGRLDRVQEA